MCGHAPLPPHPPQKDVLFLPEGMFLNRRAEAMWALTFHSKMKRRKVRPAGNSVEPQLYHKGTHQCTKTHQCPSPLKSLINMFSCVPPRLKSKGTATFVNDDKSKKKQNMAVQTHIIPQRGD